MVQLIRNREIVQDAWVHVPDDSELPAKGDVIVTLDRWKREREPLLARTAGRLGVGVRRDQLATVVGPDAAHFDVIALEFPNFRDGRGYSTARILRERYQYRGELRAVGDVLRDQLFYMARCGFSAFELKPGKDIVGALEAFDDFSVKYQPAADESLPLYRRIQR
jgi:uncharacterized protein (DUF934 family)